MPKRTIGITLGDVAGIGPEVVRKALASGKLDKRFRYEVIGKLLKVPTGKVSAKAGRAAGEWVVEGVRRCQSGELAALVTAPLNKEGLHAAGYDFPGHTELLAKLTHTKKFAMMMVGGGMHVALATIHIPLASVSAALTKQKIVEVIELTHVAMKQLGISKPRIAVAGLNPHAGEGGAFGREEINVIGPAVHAAVKKGIDARGPMAADALFVLARQKKFDAEVVMYHDQGLIPLKMWAFESGVNWTIGLPIIRTSPDHGTAYDIAGKGIADPSSMIAAINFAARLAGRKDG
ncbi:MAG: 4-hydroxythreonine-4-phosphate dehydrogenase PdxA [Verrucomicrobiae bacterium]|nr:4-hydroxythreonine-4-phosphate dehydrogenase PdxA [Verrucomicrobiae bacterium]